MPDTPTPDATLPPPVDPHFETRVRASFARQRFMSRIGAEMTRVAPGEVSIGLPVDPDLTQQQGFLHGDAIAVADGRARTVATMQATMMTVQGRDDVRH